MTTQEAIDIYLNRLQSLGRHQKSITRYRQALAGLPAVAPEPDLDAYLEWLDQERERLSHNGHAYAIRVLKQLAKIVSRRTKDPQWRDIYDALEMPRIHATDIHVPTAEHVEAQIRQALFGSEAWRDATVLILLADLGLRAGEVTNLKWSDLDVGAGRIHVGEKAGQRRVLPLRASARLQEILLRRRQHYRQQIKDMRRRGREEPEPHYVTGSVFYERPQYTMLLKVLAKVAADSKTPYIRPHLWRYFYVNTLADAGVEILTIRYAMGHQDLKTTMSYLDRGGRHAERLAQALIPTLPEGGLPWAGTSNG